MREAEALRASRLGVVYIAIMMVESVIVLGAGWWFFREAYSALRRQIRGEQLRIERSKAIAEVGVAIVDITNPLQPRQIGRIDTDFTMSVFG